ncbi:MAG: cytosine deaminase [Microcystaceae cyanobacterium]
MQLPNSNSYWLKNAHIPSSLLDTIKGTKSHREGLCLVNLAIDKGIIKTIQTSPLIDSKIPVIDLHKKMVLPGFIDSHTHLDKGHTWGRSPNLDRTFETALKTVTQDDQKYGQPEDVYRRMEFGLKCSYVHGTTAIRTHIDALGEQADIRFKVFQDLKKQWQDRLTLQAVSLVPLDYFFSIEGVKLADQVAEINGVLGGFAVINPQLDSQLEQVFKLAKERNLSLDFHVDENGNPNSTCLQKVAETAIKLNFKNTIVCGHCCSLAVQDEEQVKKTIELVKQANIKVISLPMCNLFLQDRKANLTPTWRGITRVHELNKAGISVAFASDNCRDPFYGFGDHDGLEVLSQSVKIAHLDNNYNEWIKSVTKIPADIMELPQLGRIKEGYPADLIIFNARYYSELLSRPQSDRIVLRQGQGIDTTLPDYTELDDLMY